jgi:hypothetical protein
LAVEAPEYTAPNNVDILNAIRKNAGLDYQRRIPAATKANIQETISDLWDYAPSRNEFLDALINKIGLTLIKSQLWTNPLAKWKRGMLEFGDTIEEINAGLLEAKVYDANRDYLEKDIFGAEYPDVQSSFHKVNRENYYKLTVKEPLLRRAFLSENGLSTFVSNLMQTPATSDQWDEFLLTCSLLPEYDRNGGFFKINVPDLTTVTANGNDARYALRRMREMAGNLQFISTRYNASGMPIAATPDELELIITPEANAAIDVEALAGAFNIDKSAIPSRTTIIPKEHFGIDGAQAIMTTRDFFVMADQRLETTSAANPIGLFQNYFFHHWEVVSASRFVPAILFTTDASTPYVIDDYPVTGLNALVLTDINGDTATNAVRGSAVIVTGSAITQGTNNAVRYELSGNVSPRTKISQTGVLLVSIDEASESLTVTAYAVDSSNPQLSETLTIPVVGDKAEIWPNPTVLSDSNGNGLLEVTPPAPTFVSPDITVPTSEGVTYNDGATDVSGKMVTITGASGTSKTITATAKAGYELASGATANWVFTKA